MRRKLNSYGRAGSNGDFLLDFREVPVFGHAVWAHTLVALDKQVILLRLAAGATDAAERIGDDAGRFHQTGFEQWYGGQQDACRVATGRSDERGLLDLS